MVPQTGGTKSYADMLTHARHGTIADSDEFVDAREAQGSPERRHSRHNSHHDGGGKEPQGPNTRGARTLEELTLENATLKHDLTELAGRLRAFELHSHSQSIMAASVVRGFVGVSPTASVRELGGGREVGSGRNRKRGAGTAEEKVNEDKVKGEKVKALEEELEGVVGKYRERFESLKGSARERVRKEEKEREERESRGSGGGG